MKIKLNKTVKMKFQNNQGKLTKETVGVF